MTLAAAQTATDEQPRIAALSEIERRVLWLAVRIVDYANRERPKDDSLKVGGHQASSASMVSLMTGLYFSDLTSADRVSVKPHASPVLHAIEYLLGRLDVSHLKRFREFGGLQPYPSRTKDPYPVDFSTGSVGLGSAAPLFGALADRYLAGHFGSGTGGRFISLLGDAELDEGNIWEALGDPLVRSLGNVLWIVDVNRQSLDRVIPGRRTTELARQFEVLGWHVIELKYGRRLRALFAQDGGSILRDQLDGMTNEQYQGLFVGDDERALGGVLQGLSRQDTERAHELLEDQGELMPLLRDLGGHDIAEILRAFAQGAAETTRPTVIFAHTVKGYGLEIAGRPMNHSALLSTDQMDRLRIDCGITRETEWYAFTPDTAAGSLCREAAARLSRPDRPRVKAPDLPASLGTSASHTTSTQGAFGRMLLDLSRQATVGERVVTVSPDVAVSTSLGGWINKVGTWAPDDEPIYDPMEDSPLRWRVRSNGQHIELGIAEMNLALLLGQLGLTWDCQGEPLYPIGTLYDPFVMRALEGIVYSVYSGARFLLVGTPSGISLSREGGAHQSLITPGIGIECPKLTYAEPCYALELEWLLLDALRRMHEPDGEATYLRLSTTPVDQSPFAAALARRGEQQLRSDVLAGGFRVREPLGGDDRVIIAACGTTVQEALAAGDALEHIEGVDATVLCLSSPDRLYRDWRKRALEPVTSGTLSAEPSHLEELLTPAEHGVPIVTVIDGASHALAWLGGALGVRCIPLGVDEFGQVGNHAALRDEYGISTEAIVAGALAALDPPAAISSTAPNRRG